MQAAIIAASMGARTAATINLELGRKLASR
jgi:hypothetical protein